MRRSAVYARSDGEGADDETEGLAGSGEGSSAQRAEDAHEPHGRAAGAGADGGWLRDLALAAVLFVLVKLLQGWMWGDGEEVI